METNLDLKIENGFEPPKFCGLMKITDHTFYYQHDKNNYKVSCYLISHSLVNQLLNKIIYNVELLQDDKQQQKYLTFSNTQRVNLEVNLQSVLFRAVEKMNSR